MSATIALAVGSLFSRAARRRVMCGIAFRPIDQKIDQVDQSSQKRDSTQVADINKTNQVIDEDEKKLDATSEIAGTADNEAKGATAKADQNTKGLNDLRSVVANIDDYKAGQHGRGALWPGTRTR